MGVLMVVDGPWTFDALWIVLGLAGYLATFVIALLVMEPWAKRINRIVERERHFSPEAAVQTRKFLVVARIDTLVVFFVIVGMVLKPTADDAAALLAMAAVLGAGIALLLIRTRAIGSRT